jgi:hypothetical protein
MKQIPTFRWSEWLARHSLGDSRVAAGPGIAHLFVGRDMKLHSLLLAWTGFLTKPCVSPQVFHGSMRLAGWAEWPLLPEVWSLPGNVANLVASDRGRARIGGQGQIN